MAAGYAAVKVQAEDALWNDRPCEELRYSMCQKKKEKGEGPTPTRPPSKGCPIVSHYTILLHSILYYVFCCFLPLL